MIAVLLMLASFIGSIAIPKVSVAPRIDGSLDDPAWKHAAVAHLTYDLRTHQPAADATTDYVMTDGTYLYVGVDAKQSIPVRAIQHTNDVGLDTDDEVQIDLWPNGTSGFQYLFITTALGTHYQFSSENTSYEPTWYSVGKLVPGGFTVTMKIPLNIMHSSGSAAWRVQFARLIEARNNDLVWSYDGAQQNHNDVNYAGYAAGLPQLAALRAQPRIGIYALGAVASPRAGGSTSRAGVDMSLPIIPGTSLVTTLHPDYSDVEQDQQTIAPTAFQRIFNEVRPFFTQGANFYNNTPNCTDCPGTQLYTPAIPTPRDGYAIEGKRGLFSYAAFDAVGVGRSDTAQVLNYASPNQKNAFTIQRNAIDYAAFKDDSVNLSFTHDNLRNFSTWIRYANDSGTNVLAGNRAQRYEGGVNFYTPTSSLQAELRKVGEYFNPADGLIFHPDIAGYVVNGFKAFKFPSTSRLKEIDVQADLQRFHGHDGGLNQSNTGLWVSLTTSNLLNLQLTSGSQYVLLSNGIFSPVNQQGIQLTYDYGSATPARISFNTGRFGPGRLNSWSRSATLRTGQRGSFTLEADDTDQFLDNGQRYRQWLERASFAYQSGRDESLALGVRRIIGFSPYLTSLPDLQSGWNISAAFRRKVPGGELYVVYGDAATFSTVPQFIVKFIRYVGADKGT
jgi:Domain of unknown function (DUF5916)